MGYVSINLFQNTKGEMMDITSCNKCKIQSPDEDGLFIANHWYEVKYTHGMNDMGAGRLPRTWHKLDLCEKCFGELLGTLKNSSERIVE